MLKYIYVDTENIGNTYLEAMKKMDETYTVFIMFTENSPKIPLDIIEDIRDMRCKFRAIRSKCGVDNALDFSIMAYMGWSISKRPKSLHVVLSNDNGYQAAIQMMQTLGNKVIQVHPGTDTILFKIDTDGSVDEHTLNEMTNIFHKEVVKQVKDGQTLSDEAIMQIRMTVRATKNLENRFGLLVALIKNSLKAHGLQIESNAKGKFITTAIKANIKGDVLNWNNFIKSMRTAKNNVSDKELEAVRVEVDSKIYKTGFWMQ